MSMHNRLGYALVASMACACASGSPSTEPAVKASSDAEASGDIGKVAASVGASRRDAAADVGVGLPYKGVANSKCADLTKLGVAWYYDWTLRPGACGAARFIPMIWGHHGAEQTAAGVADEVSALAQ